MKKLLFTFIIAVSITFSFAQPTGGNGVTDDQLQLNTITTACHSWQLP